MTVRGGPRRLERTVPSTSHAFTIVFTLTCYSHTYALPAYHRHQGFLNADSQDDDEQRQQRAHSLVLDPMLLPFGITPPRSLSASKDASPAAAATAGVFHESGNDGHADEIVAAVAGDSKGPLLTFQLPLYNRVPEPEMYCPDLPPPPPPSAAERRAQRLAAFQAAGHSF